MAHSRTLCSITPLVLAPIFMLCVLTVRLSAQPPRTFSYQGVLRDGAGPLKGPHSITIRMYNAGGDALYTESHSVVLADGTFDILVGSQTPIPSTVTFHEPYTLGILVDDGIELSPRMPLTAAPYALNSTSINGASGEVKIVGGNGIDVRSNGNTITIGSTKTALHLPYDDTSDVTTAAFSVTNSSTGHAGLFTASRQSNMGAALEGVTMSGIDASGPIYGASGVLGRSALGSTGAFTAGVRGINQSITNEGIGVVGYQAGSGWGVYGEVQQRGIGVYGYVGAIGAQGVRGEAVARDAVGVNAAFSGEGVGTALQITNGALRVSGPNRPGFVHVCTPASRLDSNVTEINDALTNGNPNAVLIVTHQLTIPAGGGKPIYNNSPVGVYYDTFHSRWQIHYESGAAIPFDSRFNVWVISQ